MKDSTIIIAGLAAVGLILYFSMPGDAAPSVPGSAASVSDTQLSQTEGFEGFSATAYKDGSTSSGTQLYSIGYGHQVQPGESYLLTGSISQAQAEALLQSDMQTVINAINNSGQVFTQGQFDALADFGYNAGTGALNNLITSFVNNGPDSVPSLMLQYVYWHPVPGGAAQINQNLVTRRNAEVATWNS